MLAAASWPQQHDHIEAKKAKADLPTRAARHCRNEAGRIHLDNRSQHSVLATGAKTSCSSSLVFTLLLS